VVIIRHNDESWVNNLTSPGADFGHDGQIIAIGREHLSSDLVRDERTVKVSCIDMSNAALDNLSQETDRAIDISPPYQLVAISARKLMAPAQAVQLLSERAE